MAKHFQVLLLVVAIFFGAEASNIELKRLNNAIDMIHKELIALKKEVHHLKTAKKLEDSNPGFTVYANAVQNAASGDVIDFAGEITNFGGHFDAATSTFTCPFTGSYFFSVSLRSDQNVLDAAIKINDANVLGIRIRDVYQTETNSLLTTCNEGDIVTVEATGAGDVYGDDTDASLRVSTFSGFLLRVYV